MREGGIEIGSDDRCHRVVSWSQGRYRGEEIARGFAAGSGRRLADHVSALAADPRSTACTIASRSAPVERSAAKRRHARRASRYSAGLEDQLHHEVMMVGIEVRLEMSLSNAPQPLCVGGRNTVLDAATQERGRQVAFLVRCQYNKRHAGRRRGDRSGQLCRFERQAPERLQQVVRHIRIGLVDLVDQHNCVRCVRLDPRGDQRLAPRRCQDSARIIGIERPE